MQQHEIRGELDLSQLVGKVLTAYAQDSGYWHLFVAVLTSTGSSFEFRTRDEMPGPRFEVFPITLSSQPKSDHNWISLPEAVTVDRAFPLWRFEWLEDGALGPALGSNPQTQYAGRGPAPTNAALAARVLAGVLIKGTKGELIVVAASDSASFNVEVALTLERVATMLNGFERVVELDVKE